MLGFQYICIFFYTLDTVFFFLKMLSDYIRNENDLVHFTLDIWILNAFLIFWNDLVDNFNLEFKENIKTFSF